MTLKFRTKVEQGWTVDATLSAFNFPAGEAHIKGAEAKPIQGVQYQLADIRGYDAQELFQLAMWADACRRRREKAVLIMPYLPGARSDRGTPTGASVYASFLNSIGVHQIITLDPHSEYMVSHLNNVDVFPVERIIAREMGSKGDYYDHPYVGVIAPDKGAVDRAQRAAHKLHVPVFKAEKTRDFETGQLTGFTCEDLPAEGKLLIVDDICDGGGTFIGLAQATGLPRERLDLWVTHGVFSKGITDLAEYFDMIHTTDSYPSQHTFSILDDQKTYVTVHAVLPYLSGEISV